MLKNSFARSTRSTRRSAASQLGRCPPDGGVAYEVFMRKVFNAPTTWVFRSDRLSLRVQLHDAMGTVMSTTARAHRHHHFATAAEDPALPAADHFLAGLRSFCRRHASMPASSNAAKSWMQWEHSWSAWKRRSNPYKTVIPVSLFLVFIQGAANSS